MINTPHRSQISSDEAPILQMIFQFLHWHGQVSSDTLVTPRSCKNSSLTRSEIVTFDPTIPHEFHFQIIEFNPTLEALWQSQTPKPCHIHLQFQGQDLQQIAPATTLHQGLGWEGNGLQNVQERLIHFGLSPAKNSREHRNYD